MSPDEVTRTQSPPASMLAAKKTGRATADLIEVVLPEAAPGGVLVRVRACAICASDLSGWNAPATGAGTPGEWDPDNPGITGHEVSGDIVAVGAGVDAARLGEPVWIDPIAGCGQCERCRDGRQTLCESVSIVCQGFAEYVGAPVRQCRPIPPGFDYVTASMIGDMAGTPVSAVRRAAVKRGEVVAVWGLGPVGLGIVQASLIAGASLVVAVDPVVQRRSRAEAFGAVALDSARGYLDRLRELTSGSGPDVALCSVASDRAAREAFEALRLDGRMVTVAGHPPAGGEVCKWVSGSWGCDVRDWPEILEHLRAGRFSLDNYVTHVLPLSRIEEGFAVRGQDLEGSFKVVIADDPPGAPP
jgi:threonine dehydrogenase-like Zn-dependent dehydrogenase